MFNIKNITLSFIFLSVILSSHASDKHLAPTSELSEAKIIDKFVQVNETLLDTPWWNEFIQIYLSSFPDAKERRRINPFDKDSRVSGPSISELIKRPELYKLYLAILNGEVVAFGSFVILDDQNILGDYVAVRPDKRGPLGAKIMGSFFKHAYRTYGETTNIIAEVEDPNETGITDEEKKYRKGRVLFHTIGGYAIVKNAETGEIHPYTLPNYDGKNKHLLLMLKPGPRSNISVEKLSKREAYVSSPSDNIRHLIHAIHSSYGDTPVGLNQNGTLSSS